AGGGAERRIAARCAERPAPRGQVAQLAPGPAVGQVAGGGEADRRSVQRAEPAGGELQVSRVRLGKTLVAHVFEEQPGEVAAVFAVPVVARGGDGEVRQDSPVDRALDGRPRRGRALSDDGLAARPGSEE